MKYAIKLVVLVGVVITVVESLLLWQELAWGLLIVILPALAVAAVLGLLINKLPAYIPGFLKVFLGLLLGAAGSLLITVTLVTFLYGSQGYVVAIVWGIAALPLLALGGALVGALVAVGERVVSREP